MGCWSAENATRAYLQAIKMGKTHEVPDVSEFISALAAGNSSQLMVIASGTVPAESTLISLVAAAHQTGGRVACVLPSLPDNYVTKQTLGPYTECVKFHKGDVKTPLLREYKGEVDFVLIDCEMEDSTGIFRVAEACSKHGKGIVVGYNALHKRSWSSEFETHLLPIADGLLVTRLGRFPNGGERKRNKWVTTFDKYTGEEHVYRLTATDRRGD
ncbi:hypothetical protein K2173_024913 [Erythroxylum novogranatense]|uniref:Uncharacterized protein n=1 Tax=Erythroxylum novogranatense TaxID=1862640 RepID=A0AAV8UCW9_9ROSI|nr:hypothetical protein K2173_024913 [Erythroxylum novogranatense]